jgi:ABC-type branched-subunit amino acid transport system ATPase component
MAEDAILDISNVTCSYGGVQAVKDVSFRVSRGALLGIIGPNGAGKSTLIDCLSGLNRSYLGTVKLFGKDISRWAPHKIANLGLIRTFQVPRLFGRMTVLSNLMAAPRNQAGEGFVQALMGTWKSEELSLLEKAWDLVHLFQLPRVANNYGSALSGGQQRLAELSRAVMSSPTVILLDEPFAGVSPANRSHLADLLASLWRDHGLTIVMVEHRLEMVERLCNDVLVMANGSVLARGTLADLRNSPAVVEAYLGAGSS